MSGLTFREIRPVARVKTGRISCLVQKKEPDTREPYLDIQIRWDCGHESTITVPGERGDWRIGDRVRLVTYNEDVYQLAVEYAEGSELVWCIAFWRPTAEHPGIRVF